MTASLLADPSSPSVSVARRISELATDLQARMADSVEQITELNSETRIVALNARLEAARVGGTHGRAFDVVAKAIQNISLKSASVADHLMTEFQGVLGEMRELNEELATRVRGVRLSDLALANMDVIDRNLYERSCDVRWWATDQSVVDALRTPNSKTQQRATERLGQILDSYTVYFDIIVLDLDGQIRANGRPQNYPVVGMHQRDQDWFTGALMTADGTEYSQSTVHPSSLCHGERTVVYACTVRTGGQANGEPLGVLAVIFRWDALGQVIVERTPLSKEEWEQSRACIVDAKGIILADTAKDYGKELMLDCWSHIKRSERGHRIFEIDGVPYCIGHAKAPGFETYCTGWYSLVLQTREIA